MEADPDSPRHTQPIMGSHRPLVSYIILNKYYLSLYSIFSSNIPDMTEVLDVTIYDEEDDKDDEDAFLGTVSLPLLRIVPGQQWIFLKDPRRRKPAGGSQPRILPHLQIEYSRYKKQKC